MFSASVIIVLTISVGLFITYPLLTRFRSAKSGEDSRTSDLMVRRDQLFHDIRELEFDYRMGKLSEEDYAELLTQLKTEAAEVLSALEEAERTPSEKPHEPLRAAPRDADVEALVAAARQARAARLRQGPEPAKRITCPSCNAANPLEAQFCMKCGALLAAETKGNP